MGKLGTEAVPFSIWAPGVRIFITDISAEGRAAWVPGVSHALDTIIR